MNTKATTHMQETSSFPKWIAPIIRVARWICAVPAVIYTIASLVGGLAALGAVGWAGLTQVPLRSTWFTVLGEDAGRTWFDLTAVFFERKLTFVLFDYPLFGEQLWWNWIQPALDQTPVIWVGIAVAWWLVWGVLGFLLNKARDAAGDSTDQ